MAAECYFSGDLFHDTPWVHLERNTLMFLEWKKKSVLVQVAITKYHRLSVLNNKHLFLTGWWLENQDQGANRFCVWWGLVLDTESVVVSSDGKQRTLVNSYSWKCINNIIGTLLSRLKPNYLSKAHLNMKYHHIGD